MNRTTTIQAMASALLGALIWAVSPWITGMAEPWDSDSPYYLVALLSGGLALGFIWPEKPWIIFLSIWLGQLAYMAIFLPLGPLVVLGVGFLAGFSLVAFAGAALSAGVRKRFFPDRGNT
jgi:hypothetical protein